MGKKQILEAIKSYETIIIHRHVSPDPDALGSQGGLREIILHSFPDKNVFVTGQEEPSLNFLLRMDDIKDEVYKKALVIVCDTANSPRIDDQRFNMGEKLIKIDHHPPVDAYAEINWVDTDASSTSEMICELQKCGEEEGFRMNEAAARLLYAGIVGDTGRFMFPSTTKRTFELAAELVTYDFDRSDLYRELYSVDDNISRLRGYILQQFQLLPSGLCTISLTKEILDQFHVSVSESSQLVNTVSDIRGIKAWAFYIEDEDFIRVRLRSKGPVINGIAAKHNGGGHPLASGATAYSWEETEKITEELNEACISYHLK